MLIIAPPLFRRRRGRAKRSAAGLVLVSARYDSVGATLTLTFDRAIDTSMLDGTQIIVNDPVTTHTQFHANGSVSVLGPTSIQIDLNGFASATGAVARLNASALTRIVASNDGGTWAGVSGLALPFG